MQRLFRKLFLFVVLGALGAVPAGAEPWNSEISGMAALPDGGGFLTVVDTKTGPEPPWTPRVGVLKVSQTGSMAYQPFAISDWGPGEELPNDLEACCAIPGRPNEFLIAESGYYKGRFGRIFHIRVALLAGSEFYTGEVLGSFKPVAKTAAEFSTPGADQIEGMACLKNGDRWSLVLGRRGGKGEPGSLVWGELSFPGLTYQPLDAKVLQPTPQENGMRGCADLLLEERDGHQVLLRVAASDPGNYGPFASVICEAGEFVFEGNRLQFRPFPEQAVRWRLDGLKVEALANCVLGSARYCIGTDDEIFGGVWRPLP